MANALYIHYDRPHISLIAVYEKDTRMQVVNAAADQLAGVPGTIVTSQLAYVDDDNNTLHPVLIMRALAGIDAVAAGKRMRELTQPTLPCTIGMFTLNMLLCPCGYLSSSPEIVFAAGLEPDDIEYFWLRCLAGIKALNMGELFVEADAPYEALMEALQVMMVDLGVFVSEMEIVPAPDTRPCTHMT